MGAERATASIIVKVRVVLLFPVACSDPSDLSLGVATTTVSVVLDGGRER